MQEGKLSCYIVSKEGVKIDPQWVEAIQVISCQEIRNSIIFGKNQNSKKV
jgi:hypothetical protein